MASLTEHVMINKLDDDINNAIVSVGGNTEGSSGLLDYPDIIKSQLTSNKAIGEGIYQDFLYVNENNDASIYPWDGDPTESTNAPQSTVLAKSIKGLYDIMKSTERFKVLLVDELPKSEIDLSAVYLIKESHELEHTYSGCYYIKIGKGVKKIDIPEFKVDLNSLFYLTRAEYDSNLPNYIKNIEQQLKKKFGKYWEDDNFSLETLIDEIEKELKWITGGYLEELNKKIDEKIDNKIIKVDDKILDIENKLKNDVEICLTEIGKIEKELKEDIVDIEESLTNYIPKDSLKEINDEINNLQ